MRSLSTTHSARSHGVVDVAVRADAAATADDTLAKSPSRVVTAHPGCPRPLPPDPVAQRVTPKRSVRRSRSARSHRLVTRPARLRAAFP